MLNFNVRVFHKAQCSDLRSPVFQILLAMHSTWCTHCTFPCSAAWCHAGRTCHLYRSNIAYMYTTSQRVSQRKKPFTLAWLSSNTLILDCKYTYAPKWKLEHLLFLYHSGIVKLNAWIYRGPSDLITIAALLLFDDRYSEIAPTANRELSDQCNL